MSLRAQFKTDAALEQGGIEFRTGPATFQLARSGGANVKYIRMMERLCKPYRKQIAAKTLEESISQCIVQQVFACTIVLGWEGVTFDDLGDDGNEELAQFSEENCKLLFMNLPELFIDIQEVAGERAAYLEEIMEGAAGN